MENKRINWALWIGLAIPVITLIFVAIFAYMPNNLVTKYDLLYSRLDYSNGYCNNGKIYTVKNQQIVIASTTESNFYKYCNYPEADPPKIYRYNALTGESTQISFIEAQKLQIDNNPISPDNISIQRGDGYNAGIFELFGGNNNYNAMYLTNAEGKSKKINLGVANQYDFAFIGWVL